MQRKLGYQTNCWGALGGDGVGVTSIGRLVYRTFADMARAISEIGAVGYDGVELFDGNLLDYEDRKADFRSLLSDAGVELVAHARQAARGLGGDANVVIKAAVAGSPLGAARVLGLVQRIDLGMQGGRAVLHIDRQHTRHPVKGCPTYHQSPLQGGGNRFACRRRGGRRLAREHSMCAPRQEAGQHGGCQAAAQGATPQRVP